MGLNPAMGVESWQERQPGFGLDLNVHRFRDASAAKRDMALVLLHGFMDAGGSWDRVAGGLASAGYEVYAPDLRGFGKSGRVGAGGYYHFPDYVADLERMIEAVAPRELGLVGHSMGGTVAVLYTGTRPEKVQRLALLEGVGPPAVPAGAAVTRFRSWLGDLAGRALARGELASLDEALSRLARNHPGVDRAILATRLPYLVHHGPDQVLRWAYDPLHRSTSPMPFNAAVFRAFLAEIRCPVLFLGGGATGFHPEDEGERLATIKAPVTRIDLEGAGHMMHWTEPDAVVAALLKHFDGAPPR
jgi:pimeloyl-ACP methyl ester carboxylesterase